MNTRRLTIFVPILAFALFTFAATVGSSDLAGNSGMFGDFDGDGDVDALDYNAAQICASFSGPNMLVPPACLIFDSDEDGDVDLEDLAAFLVVYTGSFGGVVVEAGQLFPVFGGIGIYYSGEPGTAGNNALHGVAAQASYTQDDFWYSWSVDSQPVGSGDVLMANVASPSTAYMILSDALPGRYVFRLVVTNLITLEAGEDTSFLDIAECVCEPDQECDEISGACLDPSCLTDADCSDGIPCTDDVCTPDGDCVSSAVDCDDGDICTGTETCDVETGDCVPGTPIDCDDGEFCNGAETCEANADTGEADCVPGTDPCAEGESCDEDLDECSPVPACTADADCDDSDACTDDVCTDGVCSNDNNTADCDDGDDCTENDTCADGVCAGTAVTCPAGQLCNPASGNCEDIDCTSDADCADGFDCTTNTCNLATGACVITNENDLCDDGLSCTGDAAGDICDPSDADAGSDGCVRTGDPCSGTAPICNETTDTCDACDNDGECDDGFSCTNDTCEVDGSCTNATVDANCADPDFCDGEDVCNPTDADADAEGCVPPGTPCVGGTPVCDEFSESCSSCTSNADCDDGFSCTDDTCDGGSGACTSTPDDANCTDADFCDGVDVCDPTDADADAAGCYGPGNPCGGGTSVCDEANDTCSACTSNLDCDDGVDCTNDSCDSASGACTNAADDANCSGGDLCSDTLGCVECLVDGDCDDGVFCTGVETCGADGSCDASPGDPCSGTTPICDDTGDACNACANDGECAAIGATTCEVDGSCS